MIRRLAVLALVAAGAIATSQRAVAQFGLPTSTAHYAFLPRPSVIVRSGGFVGSTIPFHVYGDFDFKIEQSPLAIFPPVFNAKFVDPKVVGSGFINSIVDVDQALNLAGITGASSYHPYNPNLFHFRGTTGDDSKVELDALLRGSWFYLRGGTTPPEGSADFFKYEIKAIARRAPVGDINDDGVVNADDLHRWATNPALSGGLDGLLAWQQQLGEVVPTTDQLDAELNAAPASAAGAVPEPGAFGLLAMAVAALGSARRRRFV